MDIEGIGIDTNFNLRNNKLLNVGNGTVSTDGVNLGQVQSLISNSNVDLSTKKLGDLINDNLNKKIINV
mgnify:CR=1 FL=1